jgi:hypothetical protein
MGKDDLEFSDAEKLVIVFYEAWSVHQNQKAQLSPPRNIGFRGGVVSWRGQFLRWLAYAPLPTCIRVVSHWGHDVIREKSLGFKPCRFFQPKTGQPFLTNTCSARVHNKPVSQL